jgi:hypothetical protein
MLWQGSQQMRIRLLPQGLVAKEIQLAVRREPVYKPALRYLR